MELIYYMIIKMIIQKEIYRESYNEAKNNINEENIEIYVNGRKIKFNYIYGTEEIGLIKIKFKFKKLLMDIKSKN